MVRALTREPAVALMAMGVTAGIALTLLYPLASVLGELVAGENGFDLTPLVRVLTSPVARTTIGNTLLLGLLSGLLATLVGLAFALATGRVATGPLRTALRYAALLTLIAPPFALALATIFLFGRQGLITKHLLGMEVSVYGLAGLLFVQVVTFFPVAFLIFDGLVRHMDPALEEAAGNLGASRLRVMRTVTLPLLRPGFAAAFLIIFVESLADLANPLLIGGDFNVLASSTYLAIVGEYDTRKAVAYAFVLMLPSVIAYFVQRIWVEQATVVTVTGRASAGTLRGFGAGVSAPLLLGTSLVAVLVVLLYAAIIAGAFTQLLGINNSLTLDNFRFVLFGIGSRAMSDTTFLAAVAAPLATLFGFLAGWLVVRTRLPGRSAFDYLTMLGAAAPGIVLGLGLLLAFNHPPLLLSGTAAVFVIAFSIRTAPLAMRSSIAALLQIDPQLEQASANLGAGTLTTLRRITVPLVRGALLSGLIFSFARNMTALSTIALLVTPNWRIMTAQILNEIDAQRLGSGAAYSTILIVIVLSTVVLLRRLFGRSALELAA
ncbi:MAG: iron ABC transporter permease [Chloroflexi bacterium]|nr:iron ABC transporter permease [Chloroflexota bacterium]